MSKTIWKFGITDGGSSTVQMPKGAEILCAQVQKRQIFLWAVVDPELEMVNREFLLIGTGHTLNPEKYAYIDTVQLYSGELVLHLFEILS